MIVIINGPLGIGKTSVAWALIEQFERAVMLDGDYIGAVHPQRLADPARVDYLYRTLQHLLQFHYTNGYPNAVINYVFEKPASLQKLQALLAPIDPDIHSVRLVCRGDEIERRVRHRFHESDPDRLQWEVARARELLDIQARAAPGDELGTVLDTSDLSLEESVAAIRRQLPI